MRGVFSGGLTGRFAGLRHSRGSRGGASAAQAQELQRGGARGLLVGASSCAVGRLVDVDRHLHQQSQSQPQPQRRRASEWVGGTRGLQARSTSLGGRFLSSASSSSTSTTRASATARLACQWSLQHARRAFSSPPSAAASDARGGGFANERAYHDAADATLDEVQHLLEGLEDTVEDFEANLSQGVLNIVLGESGTWVLNKQTPNRQVWWSSPISGPIRFEYDPKGGKWRSTRDQRELFALLAEEVHKVSGIDILAERGGGQ